MSEDAQTLLALYRRHRRLYFSRWQSLRRAFDCWLPF